MSFADEPMDRTEYPPLVDIGVNLTHPPLRKHWKEVVQRALDARVDLIVLTGTSIQSSRESIHMCREWHRENGSRNMVATVGLHPHNAKHFQPEASTLQEMTDTVNQNPDFVVAIGECGLDFNRNFSSRDQQIDAFRGQVRLACRLNLPLFVHEREAHTELLNILDEVQSEFSVLPPIVIHCFTGSKQEALQYCERGYYVGFTGVICKNERGAHLRDLLPDVPMDRVLLETDAPFMSFHKVGKRRHSEPTDVVDVARTLSRSTGLSLAEVCAVTMNNSRRFFRLEESTNSTRHDTTTFEKLQHRLWVLEKWRELAVRPRLDECDPEDLSLLENLEDDCGELAIRCLKARQRMNDNLPSHEIALDNDLHADISSISNAGYGLYYRPRLKGSFIPKGQTICFYCGHIHNFMSAKTVDDKSYLMLISGDVLVDPGPLPKIKARYINDPLNPERTNCTYEPQPDLFRSAVVATRDILPDEELFSSYGDGYWAQQGIVGTFYRG